MDVLKDLSELAAQWASIVGAIGVVIVVYQLVWQIKLAKSDSSKYLMSQWADLMATIAESDEFASLWLRGVTDMNQLTQTEKLRFGCILGQFFRTAEGLYYLHQDGTLGPQIWRGIERTIEDAVQYKGVLTWWATRYHWHSDLFQTFVVDCTKRTLDRPKGYEGYLDEEAPLTASALNDTEVNLPVAIKSQAS